VALDLQYPLVGKLSLRGMLAGGHSAVGGPVLGGPWITGMRAGLKLDSRFGPLRVEYGVAAQGHHAWFVRLGSLF
jgi:hypothetical protein